MTVRRAEPDDVGAVPDRHARCSPTSRLRRDLAGTRCPSPSVLTELLSPTAGHALVAEDPDGGGLGHPLHREYDGGLLTLIVTLPAGQTQRLPNSM